MDEPVQTDLVDIEDDKEYRDQKCEKLEDILRKDSRFEGCIVKRIRLQKEAPELKDPFNIQNENGRHIAWFYEWEFEVLSEPEIFPYIEFQKEKEERADSYLPLDLLGIVMIIVGAASFITLLFIALTGQWIILDAIVNIPAASISLLLGILVIIIRRRHAGFRKRGVAFARDNPLFIEALRKLAPLSKPGDKLMENYAENLKILEDSIKIEN